MRPLAVTPPCNNDIPADTLAFYRDVLHILNNASLPYVVGGAYALNYYTTLNRHTEDFDIFIARSDFNRISEELAKAGYAIELTHPHWLAKVRSNGVFIDLVFSSGNGVAEVDQAWMDHAVSAETFGVRTRICPAEEIIWSKAYIMERERFDGADIAHLILARGRQLDWRRLLARFDSHWRLLLSHLTLFGFVYPAHRDVIPAWVMNDLLNRMKEELDRPSPNSNICGGTLLSREQYLNDIGPQGYHDARLRPYGKMSAQDTARWTEAIKDKNNK